MKDKLILGEVIPYQGKSPQILDDSLVFQGAKLIGDVRIGRCASVWFNAVLRGDINYVSVGDFTNIQDLALLHVERDAPCKVGSYVVVGHSAILHGCKIDDFCLIGMGAKILTGAKIGTGCIIGAGTVVLEGFTIPPGSLAVGIPAKVVRTVGNEQIESIKQWADRYFNLAKSYFNNK